MRGFLPALLLSCLLLSPAAAATDFARDVLPVLQRSCFECHGAEKQKGGLRVDSRAALLTGGESGKAIVPGDGAQSELLRRVLLPRGHEDIMPSRGEPLTQAETQHLRAWLDQGAVWPEGLKTAPHWAYQKPTRPVLPAAAAQQHPIDALVRAKLAEQDLKPAPEASAEIIARRLSLDLVGLPPAPARVASFVAAAQAKGLAKAVEGYADELLASPQYGEKWARPWLDAARYADSHGFQRDDLHDLWAYRDWVIQALNADMPFDQFSIEQLAGDLLPQATLAQKIATGFNRCAPCNVEAGTDPEENRVNQVLDRVNTLGAVWLGTTMECAQCHDHKFDPFSMRDYYGLFAFFNQTELEADRTNAKVPGSIQFSGPYMPIGDAELTSQREAMAKDIASLKQQIAALGGTVEEAGSAKARAARARQAARAEAATTKAKARAKAKATPVTEPAATAKTSPEITKLQQQLKQLTAKLKALPEPRTLVMREIEQPRASFMFTRGDFRSPAAKVEPTTPAALHPFAQEGPRTRLALARWLVSRENPLVARVTVNRLWADLFGEGLVSTPEDFGIKGEPPTHPELLDWLAVEFMERGWSQKTLLRSIVTSATYRQDSRATPQMLERDPPNRWLARGPRFRLSAEAIRDNALAIAGLLNLKAGGVPIRPPQPDGLWAKVGGQQYDYVVSPGTEQHRRGIYVVLKRGSPYPSFVNFDANARLACRVKRPRSNTPLQALTLLNDPVYVEAARALATRLQAEAPSADLDARLRFGFQLATSRSPSESEVLVLRRLFEAEAQASGQTEAAWFSIASALLNLDETITKG